MSDIPASRFAGIEAAPTTASPRPRPLRPDDPVILSQCNYGLDDGSHLRDHSAQASLPLVVDRVRTVHGAHVAPSRLDRISVLCRDRHLGRELAGGVGFRDPQLRLVDRHRIGGDHNLRAIFPGRGWNGAASINRIAESMMLFGAAAAGVYPILASRTALVRLLAFFLSEHNDIVGAVPQPASMGLLGALHVRPGVRTVLVSRALAGSGQRAGPRDFACPPGDLRIACLRLSWVTSSMATLTRDVRHHGGDHGACGGLDSQHCWPRLRWRCHRRLAFHRVPAVFRFRSFVIGVCYRAATDHRTAQAIARWRT